MQKDKEIGRSNFCIVMLCRSGLDYEGKGEGDLRREGLLAGIKVNEEGCKGWG